MVSLSRWTFSCLLVSLAVILSAVLSFFLISPMAGLSLSFLSICDVRTGYMVHTEVIAFIVLLFHDTVPSHFMYIQMISISVLFVYLYRYRLYIQSYLGGNIKICLGDVAFRLIDHRRDSVHVSPGCRDGLFDDAKDLTLVFQDGKDFPVVV